VQGEQLLDELRKRVAALGRIAEHDLQCGTGAMNSAPQPDAQDFLR
jgi:hypothetical protein